MKAPISWLKEYVDIDVPVEELRRKLVNIGFEVEGVEYLGENIENVVVGKLVKIEKHPDADRLRVCTVDVKLPQPVQIVTGASNVAEGDVVPVALDGAVLPCGKKINKGVLRGMDSFGMLCSGDELVISDDIYPGASADGILQLDKATPIGADIKKVLELDDYVLDVNITSNRPDCGSVYGLAREVAVALGKTVKPLKLDYKATSKTTVESLVSVKVLDKTLCTDYFAAAITNVKIAPSPVWVRRRLAKVGLRAISNVVDITNYVLIELGQPMHAFDHRDIAKSQIIVRRANAGEQLVLLDGKKVTLEDSMLVIADGDRAVGLAGVMGGENSEIKPSTAVVVFESARFNRENIRKTGRKLGIATASQARFEKGVDAYTARLARERALCLVGQLGCADICAGGVEVVTKVENSAFEFEYSEISRRLGITVEKADVKRILKSLDVECEITGERVRCVAPLFRSDLVAACDIIEEIIRIYGYDKIMSRLLADTTVTKGGWTEKKLFEHRVRDFLRGVGFSQTVTYSFGGRQLYDKLRVGEETGAAAAVFANDYIEVLNPLGEELSLMRKSLVPHMLNAVAQNHAKNNYDLRLFEIAKTYHKTNAEMPHEPTMLCAAVSGAEGDFYTLKDMLFALLAVFDIAISVKRAAQPFLHPGKSAEFVCGGRSIGYIGALHPLAAQNFDITKSVIVAELCLDTAFELRGGGIKYKAIPRFPSINRDLALIVDEAVAVGDLFTAVRGLCPLCETVELFDVYRGSQVAAGKKSVALALKFRSEERTLQDAEINAQIDACLAGLKSELGAVLRQ